MNGTLREKLQALCAIQKDVVYSEESSEPLERLYESLHKRDALIDKICKDQDRLYDQMGGVQVYLGEYLRQIGKMCDGLGIPRDTRTYNGRGEIESVTSYITVDRVRIALEEERGDAEMLKRACQEAINAIGSRDSEVQTSAFNTLRSAIDKHAAFVKNRNLETQG